MALSSLFAASAASVVSAIFTHDALAQTASSPQTVLVTASRAAQPITDVLLDHEIISADEIAGAGFTSGGRITAKKARCRNRRQWRSRAA